MHSGDFAPGFQVRLASPGELGMAFAMLPHVAGKGILPESVFVAEMPGVRGIVGAAVFSSIPVHREKSGLRGDIFVLPSYRRRGIGRSLLVEMKKSVRAWDIGHLHAWNAMETASEPGFLSRAGFQVWNRVLRFEVDAAKACEVLDAWLARRKSRRQIPPGAEVLPLAAVNRMELVRLYAEYFGCLEQQAREYFTLALAEEMRAELSFGLALDGRLIGFILWKRDHDGVPVVELWITKPSFHTGWPAIALLAAAIHRGAQLGHARGRFECDESAGATLHMARLLDARLLNTMANYVLEV